MHRCRLPLATRLRRTRRMFGFLLLALLLGKANPGIAAPPSFEADWGSNFSGSGICLPGLGRGTWISEDDDGRIRVRIREKGVTIKMNTAGVVTPNDDDTDIADVSAGGHFELEERRFGRRGQKIMIFRDSGGSLVHRYYHGRKEKPFDAEARTWLATTLPRLYRNTTLAVPTRVRRFLTKGGVDGALAEISEVESDHVARAYYAEVLRQANLDAAGVQRLVEHAGRQLDSDYELAELLLAAMKSDAALPAATQVALVDASHTLDSNYERGRVLAAVVDHDTDDTEVTKAVLRSVQSMSSDYEIAQVLVRVARRRAVDAASTPEFFAAVGKMDSNYEARRVLDEVVERGHRSPETVRAVIAGAGNLDSDYERAELLRALAGDKNWQLDGEAARSYVAAARGLGSDHERGRALQALLERDDLDTEALVALVQVAGDMGSNYERATLLLQVLETHGRHARVRDAIREAARRIDSDYERNRVLAKLGETSP